ncbi:hypothetical protein [Myroides fluvii]|uniref:hypothetical protein n=1 Tax=Myroides fluvii TaxID=2572594 RepID=UPI00131E5EC2|nr:hypothetical protein [Myroides fluvii]
MANLEWFPVSPVLDEQGGFYALKIADETQESLKPVELSSGDQLFSQSEVLQRSISVNLAAELGILTSTASVVFNSYCFCYEVMLFTDKITSTPIAGKIYGTRWGAGLRIILNVSDFKGDTQFKFGAIAASAELGLAKVEYRINTIGFNDSGMLSMLPDPGEFDFVTYSKIIATSAFVKQYMADNLSKLTPQPFQVYLSRDYSNYDIDKARSILYAANAVKARLSLLDAILKGKGVYDENLIRNFYAQMGITDERAIPSKDLKKRANQFLSF